MSKSDTAKSRIPASNGEEVSTPTETAAVSSPFSCKPEDLWIDPNKIHGSAGTKKIITTILLRKPNKHEFFRVHGGGEFWKPMALIELERELYVVHPSMEIHLDPTDIYYVFLCLAISKSGLLFFWPVKISRDERRNSWNDSALDIAKQAVTTWVKIRSRQEDGKGSGYYEADAPIADFGEPAWPDLSLTQLYDIAFKGDRIINRMDHLVIQKLSGQVK